MRHASKTEEAAWRYGGLLEWIVVLAGILVLATLDGLVEWILR